MRSLFATAAIVALMATTSAASAQQALEGRVDRLEREVRAVQRKVFPGGAGATVEPEITAPRPTDTAPGTPAGGALTDLTERVSTLESGVRSVTEQVEQANYRVRQLEDAFNAYKRATDARLKTLEDGAGPATSPASGASGDEDTPSPAASARPRPAASDAVEPAELARPSPASVTRPKTGDDAEDGYTYGYRLWQAKLYPEAERELKAVADKYPKHRRASFAQNLLGRAYLDEGKPSLASIAFYDSYKKWPDGERAPDSLLYLGQALVTLKKPADACKVYGELTDVYGAKLSASMKADVAKGRAAAKCK